jgi:hypothetical protein
VGRGRRLLGLRDGVVAELDVYVREGGRSCARQNAAARDEDKGGGHGRDEPGELVGVGVCGGFCVGVGTGIDDR